MKIEMFLWFVIIYYAVLINFMCKAIPINFLYSLYSNAQILQDKLYSIFQVQHSNESCIWKWDHVIRSLSLAVFERIHLKS